MTISNAINTNNLKKRKNLPVLIRQIINRDKAIALINTVAKEQNAGIILLDLEPDNYFPYHHQFQL